MSEEELFQEIKRNKLFGQYKISIPYEIIREKLWYTSHQEKCKEQIRDYCIECHNKKYLLTERLYANATFDKGK